MNKVDLNNLTYYGNEKIRVNWKDSIGEKIPFQYDDIKGELEIVDYDSINRIFVHASIVYSSIRITFNCKSSNLNIFNISIF